MKRMRSILWQVSPKRALIESWLVCAGLLIPIFPVVFEATPLARSLYLVLLPLLCAVVASLHMRFFTGPLGWTIGKECGLGLLLSLGILGIVFGVVASLGRMDAIRYSYAGTGATIFFLMMSLPEYLGIRLFSWAWRYWERLRRRRFIWALTHTFLIGVVGLALLVLTGAIIYLVRLFGNDIWQIPSGSFFALAVFWLTIAILLASVLLVTGMILFLPPAMLFSFLAARKMTARVEALAATTRVLRQGQLGARVPVQGEDEVAQLQADFNAMAADLEQSVRELREEKDKVWALMEARRELVAEVSHELRNPVATITGYIDALSRGWKEQSPDSVNHDLETLQYEAARLEAILNDLLAAAQIETGHLSLAMQPVDVTALAQRLVNTFARLAWTSKRVQVSLSAPSQAVFAMADPLRLEQVLVNLVQNALRHTAPGGLVAVEVQEKAGQVCIEVEDTGEGIAPEDIPYIWEKYYQAGSTQPARSGMGLGLALVKELTEAMGGSVSVESWLGQGSVFRVELRESLLVARTPAVT